MFIVEVLFFAPNASGELVNAHISVRAHASFSASDGEEGSCGGDVAFDDSDKISALFFEGVHRVDCAECCVSVAAVRVNVNVDGGDVVAVEGESGEFVKELL